MMFVPSDVTSSSRLLMEWKVSCLASDDLSSGMEKTWELPSRSELK